MKNNKLGIGFIGAGGIARGHFQRLMATGEAEVIALADPSRKSIHAMKEAVPESQACRVFRDYRTMLEKVELDAVQIHSPHTLHFQQAMDSMDLGLHCLIEKPMACKTSHARRIIAKAKKKKVHVTLSYQRHFEPGFRYVKEALASGELGELVFISAWQAQAWLQFTRGTWRQDPALSGGGQINDSGSHLLDIIMWASGAEPEEVFAFMDNKGTPVDIVSAVSIRFQGGILGNLSIIGHSGTNFHEDLSFWGTKGNVHLRRGQLLRQDGRGPLHEVTNLPKGSNPDEHFVNLILGREEPQAPPECGLQVIRLTEAAWESARKDKPVRVWS